MQKNKYFSFYIQTGQFPEYKMVGFFIVVARGVPQYSIPTRHTHRRKDVLSILLFLKQCYQSIFPLHMVMVTCSWGGGFIIVVK